MTKDFALEQKGNQVHQNQCGERALVASDQAPWSEATKNGPMG